MRARGAAHTGQPQGHSQQGHSQQGHPQPGHPQPGAAKQAPSRPDASAVLNRQPSPPVRSDTSRRAQSAAASASPPSGQPAASQAGVSVPADHKRLLVGKEISLSGEIRSCDTLVVEGTVEAELNGTQILDIQQSGLFKGSATVDTAEIAGRFEGKLTVRERLHVHATGHIHGEIKYKNLEIDSGGRIGGTLMELSPEEAETAHHTAGVGNGAAGSQAGGGAASGAASGGRRPARPPGTAPPPEARAATPTAPARRPAAPSEPAGRDPADGAEHPIDPADRRRAARGAALAGCKSQGPERALARFYGEGAVRGSVPSTLPQASPEAATGRAATGPVAPGPAASDTAPDPRLAARPDPAAPPPEVDANPERFLGASPAALGAELGRPALVRAEGPARGLAVPRPGVRARPRALPRHGRAYRPPPGSPRSGRRQATRHGRVSEGPAAAPRGRGDRVAAPIRDSRVAA
ncbi:MAG: polymer-forming cytoskeletal protein [Rhodovibrio sp.]|nr:polymer-forming cytoskeletal protein [Rhodovibrio sp.]